MRAVLREPLVHFLAIGAALFAVSAWFGSGGPGSRRIIVSPGQVGQLAAEFEREKGRAPRPEELDDRIAAAAREEMLVREARFRGLDRDDPAIRRRLQELMESQAQESGAPPQPTDRDLELYLAEHADQFRQEPWTTFRQLFVSAEMRGERAEADAADLLATLRRSPDSDPALAGDPFHVPRRVEFATRSEVARLFGEGFAAALAGLPSGGWQGPVASEFGVHLVRIEDRRDGRLPALAEIRGEVERAWLDDRRRAAAEQFYDELSRRYRVRVHRPTER